jgi:hypothetical protein
VRTDTFATASPIEEPQLRLNVVCPYYTMFPLAFPLRELQGARANEWVLDPFCGRGTTAYAARLLGLPSVGIDTDSVAVAVARAKLLRRSADQVVTRLDQLLEERREPEDLPEGEFWSLAFDTTTLGQICRLREALLRVDTEDDILLRAIVLGILHGPLSVREPNYLSNQMPRTYATKPGPAINYWRRMGHLPRRVDIRAAVSRRARYVLTAVPEPVAGIVLRADSRQVSTLGLKPHFSWVVTSPPYLGMRTYRPDQWLRHWFLGGPSDVDYGAANMLPAGPPAAVAEELGKVWSAVATVCRSGAVLTVRFGTLPSYRANPEGVLRDSLAVSDAEWVVESVVSAGTALLGKRQAGQMKRAGQALDEIDLKARLVA